MQEGFGEQLETLSFRTHALRFTLPIAEESVAEAGLLHVLGILNEQELRQDRDQAGKALAEDPSDENLRRFETLRDLLLEAESRRRDPRPARYPTRPHRSLGPNAQATVRAPCLHWDYRSAFAILETGLHRDSGRNQPFGRMVNQTRGCTAQMERLGRNMWANLWIKALRQKDSGGSA